MTDLPPDKRSNGMVFQNYALFPHMTVEQNIAYGLKRHRVPRTRPSAASSSAWRWCGWRAWASAIPGS